MASFLYNSALELIVDRTIDLASNTLKVMLVTGSYTANKDHIFVDEAGTDVLSCEVSGTGYTGGHSGSGRKTLTNKDIVKDDATDRVTFVADNIFWTELNVGAVAGAVIYQHGTTDANSHLIAFVDSGGFPKTTDGGTLNLNWNAAGIFKIESPGV